MINRIKFNYISKDNAINAMDMLLTELYFSTNGEQFKIIDNMKAIRIYPSYIEDNITRTVQADLTASIEISLKQGVQGFIINNFEIDFDYAREVLMPLAKKYDAYFFILSTVEKDMEDRVTISFTEDIIDIDDEKWEIEKTQAEEAIKTNINKQASLNNKKTDKNNKNNDDLLKLFGLEFNDWDSVSEENNEDDEIKETYSHELKENILTISLTNNNNLIISDDYDSITIKNNQIKYLVETIKNLIKL